MDKIPYINIADTQVWMIYLMPFSKEIRTDYNIVNKLQQQCIEEKIFGMGWGVSGIEVGTEMTQEWVKKYIEKCDNQQKDLSKQALEGYRRIKKGDYAIMRLKDNHYYVGKVQSDRPTYLYKENDALCEHFSWGAKVERWVEYTGEDMVPSEIVGRFSQRIHQTIQKIAPYRQRLLVIAMYENKISKEKRVYNVPKLHVTIDNFVRSLTYSELEDLVADYIDSKHNCEGYRLRPSTCKNSQQKYEFRFVAKGKKTITCQVKNQHVIEIENYVDDTEYERIYIFCGKWDQETVEKLREIYKNNPQLYIISPNELFDILKNTYVFESRAWVDFYDLNDSVIMPDKLFLEGYNMVDNVRAIKTMNDYTMSDDFVCFFKREEFYYSAEFGAFVLDSHTNQKDLTKEEERKQIEKIVECVNSHMA